MPTVLRLAKWRWPWSVAVVLFTFAVPLAHPTMSPPWDWDEFNSFSHFVRSSVWSYHTWPLHDPWTCGGHDLWANPQQRLFSPLVLLDLCLPAHLANLASLMVMAFVGHYLAIRLFEALDVSRRSAVTCASLWILSSWFGLHFSEGHIAYGMIQLIPGVALCALRIDRPIAQVGLAGLGMLCVLSGGIYAAIFSIYAVLTLLPIYWPRLRTLLREIVVDRQTRWRVVLVLAGLAACAAVRIVPAMMTAARTEPELEVMQPPFGLIMRMLFHPDQMHDSPIPADYATPFGYHEYGAYFGVLAIAIVVLLFVRRRSSAGLAAIVGAVGAAFWIWVATGRLAPINPWRLHQSIPIVNIAHVQTRLLIIAWFLLLIPLARALDTMRPRGGILCIALLLAEASIINTRLYLHTWQEARPVSWPLIRSVTIERTVYHLPRPELYFTSNTASAACYEASVERWNAIAESDPRYRGEVWATGAGADCHPRLTSFTPGEARVQLDGCNAVPFELHLNTNTLAGFSIEPSGAGSQVSRRRQLLGVRIDRAVPGVTLRYAPRHCPWVLSLLVLGAGALIAAFVLARRSSRPA
jgi:hypothetical protein